MDDRTMLELAARAAGIDGAMCDAEYCKAHGPDVITYGMWNPLTDDGDAFRLSVQLEMKVDFGCSDGICMAICKAPRIRAEHREPIADDRFKAARFAIVRAAAAIGQEMTNAQG